MKKRGHRTATLPLSNVSGTLAGMAVTIFMGVISGLSGDARSATLDWVANAGSHHLIASTGNLYWTNYQAADDVGGEGGDTVRVYRTGKNDDPGDARVIYEATVAEGFKPLGAMTFAYVSNSWYGYVVHNDQTGYDDNLYTSIIKRIPLAGGAATTIAVLPRYVGHRDLATDGSYLYWADVAGLRRMPVGGGAKTLLAGLADGKLLRLVDDYIYFSDGVSVRRVRKNGGVVESLYTGLNSITALHVHGRAGAATLYLGNGSGSVISIKEDGTNLKTLQAPIVGRTITSVGFDGRHTFWTDCAGGGQCVARMRTGETTTAIDKDGVGFASLQWDNNGIYWGTAWGIRRYKY